MQGSRIWTIPDDFISSLGRKILSCAPKSMSGLPRFDDYWPSSHILNTCSNAIADESDIAIKKLELKNNTKVQQLLWRYCPGKFKSTGNEYIIYVLMRSTQVWNIYLSYHLRGKTASWPLRLVVLPSSGKSQFTWDSILLLLSFSSTKLVFSISEGTAINLSRASKLLSVCSRFLRVIQHQRWAKEYFTFRLITQLFPIQIGHLNILQCWKPCQALVHFWSTC